METTKGNLNRVEKGSGQPVVFVHGSVSDYRTWHHQMDAFSKDYRAISYSRRFHRPNEKIAEGQDYLMQQHVADLEEILDEIAEPVHLVGHSYGAFVGLLLALKSPHLLKTLTLAEPPVITLYVSDPPKPMEILKLLFTKPKTALALIKFGATGMGPATAAAKKGATEKAIEKFGKVALGKEAYSNLSAERRKQVMENFIAAEFLGSGFPNLNTDQLRTLAVPTLLMAGQNSPTFLHLLLDGLEELLPKAERVEIKAASHIMHENNPILFNQKVRSFIEKHNL